MHGTTAGRDRSWIVLISMAALLALLVVAGCSAKPSASTGGAGTAKSEYNVAKSALSTMAPDAKLLIVQTAEPTTSTPIWAYLFGSPSTDKTYVVYVRQGKAMGASEYGTAGLPKDEWATVPSGTDGWQVDSDAALQKAKDTGTVKQPEAYSMGFLTYVPKSQAASATTKPFIWYVSLETKTASSTIEVDAKTGAAKVAPAKPAK